MTDSRERDEAPAGDIRLPPQVTRWVPLLLPLLALILGLLFVGIMLLTLR